MKTLNANSATQITIKAIIIGVMILVMLIPVAMLISMIEERMEYQGEVENEIGASWGGSQTVTGPILCLPYEKTAGEGEKQTTEKGTAYFLPETLDVAGKIDPEVRSRTAHKVLLYKSGLTFSGTFVQPDIESLGLEPEDIRWGEATLYVGITHLQGVQSRLAIEWDGLDHSQAIPVNNKDLAGTGLTVRIPMNGESPGNADEKIRFHFGLNLNGTGKLFLSPVGRETTANLQSEWETVSFSGNTLPASHNLEDGFSANWKVFDFNRSYPQAWLNQQYALTTEYDHSRSSLMDYQELKSYHTSPVLKSAFGADLRFPLDHYQLSMRSVKYALMFIALTFFVFFLAELLSHRRIHPIQYLLVSCGLVLFYSLLLALSEHIGFDWAYLVSAIAIVGLITAYSGTIFKKRNQTLRMGMFLTALYVYLYVMLQLEDMALLFGSVGLFIALAIIMYVSRKIKWYKNSDDPAEENTGEQTKS